MLKKIGSALKNAVLDAGRITYRLWSRFLGIVGNIKVYRWPMFVIYDPTYFKMDGKRILEALGTIEPGDIILRGYDHYLDSNFIDGDYSHGAIVVGKDEIVHAISPKVGTIHPVDFMECDRICVLRPKDKASAKEAAEAAKEFVGVPYDFGFDTGDSEEVYCFELVARCHGKTKFEKYLVKKFFGLVRRHVYLAKSFLLNDGFEIVFEYNPRKGYDSRRGAP